MQFFISSLLFLHRRCGNGFHNMQRYLPLLANHRRMHILDLRSCLLSGPVSRDTARLSQRQKILTNFGRPQKWERMQVGFGSTGKKRKGPCTKQCAWRKHGSSDTRLAEACPPKLRNTVKYRVEEMRPKWPFWKHRAPKMRLVEAQCAYRKHCYPETPLGSPPTSGVSQ